MLLVPWLRDINRFCAFFIFTPVSAWAEDQPGHTEEERWKQNLWWKIVFLRRQRVRAQTNALCWKRTRCNVGAKLLPLRWASAWSNLEAVKQSPGIIPYLTITIIWLGNYVSGTVARSEIKIRHRFGGSNGEALLVVIPEGDNWMPSGCHKSLIYLGRLWLTSTGGCHEISWYKFAS